MTANAEAAPRKASREVRRSQLIEATIDVLARKGYAALTLADVSKQAGLSGGIINFHFDSKQKLLDETLHHLVEEYRHNWQTAMAAAGSDPAARLSAMLSADYSESSYTPRILAAWIAFWAEAQARPSFYAEYAPVEQDYVETLEQLCADLCRAGGYGDLDPALVALALNSLTDGMWVALAGGNSVLPRRKALGALYAALAAFFPRHFDAEGLRRG